MASPVVLMDYLIIVCWYNVNYNETIMPFQEQKSESKICSNPTSTPPTWSRMGFEVADEKT